MRQIGPGWRPPPAKRQWPRRACPRPGQSPRGIAAPGRDSNRRAPPERAQLRGNCNQQRPCPFGITLPESQVRYGRTGRSAWQDCSGPVLSQRCVVCSHCCSARRLHISSRQLRICQKQPVAHGDRTRRTRVARGHINSLSGNRECLRAAVGERQHLSIQSHHCGHRGGITRQRTLVLGCILQQHPRFAKVAGPEFESSHVDENDLCIELAVESQLFIYVYRLAKGRESILEPVWRPSA